MTLEQWKDRAGFFLEAHGVLNFTAAEICPVGKTQKSAILEAPPAELMVNVLDLVGIVGTSRDYDYIGPLPWIRSFEGVDAIAVNSWFRSKAYNRAVGGGVKSIHLTGGAADITKFGWTPRRVAMALHHEYPDSEQLGIGLYTTFVHVDIRGLIGRRAPARWSGKGVEAGWWKLAA